MLLDNFKIITLFLNVRRVVYIFSSDELEIEILAPELSSNKRLFLKVLILTNIWPHKHNVGGPINQSIRNTESGI